MLYRTSANGIIKLYTQTEAAKVLGVSRQRVGQLIERYGLGRELDRRGRMLTDQDIQTIRERPWRRKRQKTTALTGQDDFIIGEEKCEEVS